MQVRLEKFEPFLEELRSKSRSRTVTLGIITLATEGATAEGAEAAEATFMELVETYGGKSRTGMNNV